MMIKKLKYIPVLLALGMICISCTQVIPQDRSRSKEEELPVRNLAYDADGKENYIYIKENTQYEPYLVLSNDYYGKTLLMRKYLLDEPRVFNFYQRDGAINAYYPDSLMDVFLSNDFYHTLSPEMRELVLTMDIDVTTEESVSGGPILETEKIRRKIFLLSSYEVNAPDSSLEAKEGIRQKYFADEQDPAIRIGHFKNGETWSYWLRTAVTWDDYTVCGVADGGGFVGSVSVDAVLGVRPIFCIEGNIEVYKKEIENIGRVYVIE